MSLAGNAWWGLGAVLAVFVAGGAYRAGALTRGGALAAAIIGTVIFGAGHGLWAAALLTFFLTSSALTRWRQHRKDGLGWEKTGRRDARQVWANGGTAAACALLPLVHPSVPMRQAYVLFLAALAAANADTWATEIGAALGGQPRLMTTGRRVPRGTSGAVSVAGMAAAFCGATLLSLFAWQQGLGTVLIVIGAGLFGACLDSLLGATVQAQWQDRSGLLTETPQADRPPDRGLYLIGNDLVNMLCTIAAAGLAACLLLVRPFF